jgi:alkanesulfonate monooxygenase SsuD/methylene tetrahydromethanopterin reductase-like flavin-dependent oxidoreductase (luciferase family)
VKVQPVRDQGVQITTDRTVNEGNEDTLFDLLVGLLLDQVGADSPVLLGGIEDLIVDPPAARSLQQGVVQEETEPTPRNENPRHLGDGGLDFTNVFEHEAGDDDIELFVGEWQRVGARARDVDPTATFGGDAHLVPRGVDSDHEFGSDQLGQPRHLTLTAPDVEHSSRAGQLFGCEWQDLLLVFGVHAIGETFDPPRGVRFPQVVVVVGHGPRLRPHYPARVTTIRFSVWPTPQRDWEEVRDLALWADSGPWRGIWYADHFMPNTDDESTKSGSIGECWSMIAAIAAITKNLRIGSLVSPTTFRHPAVLANVAATIDRICNGRSILGIGAGWQINEHRAYGVDMLRPADRVDRFEEAITVIASLLREERTTFDGRHFRITDAPCDPKPVQNPLPILVGTGGPRMTAITAEHAQEWNTWGTPEVARDRIDVLHRACERIGRDPSTIRCSVQGMFFVVDDDVADRASKIGRLTESAPADRALIGNLEQIADRIAGYAEAGFDEVIIPDFTLGSTPSARREMYQRFAEEVVPRYQ